MKWPCKLWILQGSGSHTAWASFGRRNKKFSMGESQTGQGSTTNGHFSKASNWYRVLVPGLVLLLHSTATYASVRMGRSPESFAHSFTHSPWMPTHMWTFIGKHYYLWLFEWHRLNFSSNKVTHNNISLHRKLQEHNFFPQSIAKIIFWVLIYEDIH